MYIQLERRGLHHINSHIGANKEPKGEEYDEEPPELVEGSDDEDNLESQDEEASDAEDDDPGDADDSVSADDGL